MKNRIISRTICLIILSYLLIVIAMPTPEDKDEPEVVVVNIPSMAVKAGGRSKPEFIENSNDTETQETTTVNSNDDYYDEDYEYDPEKNCNGDQYYHEKGQQCVSKLCNFGRDDESGDCLYGASAYFGSFGGSRRYGVGGRSSWIKAKGAGKSIGSGMVGRGKGRG